MRELNELELNQVVGGTSHHGKKHVHVTSSAASSANVGDGRDSTLKKHCIPTPPIVLPDTKHL
jgi:bacteriocin-like protein